MRRSSCPLGRRGWQLSIDGAVLEAVGVPDRYIMVETGVVTQNQMMAVGGDNSWPSIVLAEDPVQREQPLKEIGRWLG